MMDVVHKVTGYDKSTEFLELEFELPDEHLERLQGLSNVSVSYKDALGGLPLSDIAALELATMCHVQVDKIGLYDWFIEPFPREA